MSETEKTPAPSFVRPYQATDGPIVKQLVGQGFMEGMGKANNKVYLHPVTLIFVVVFGLFLDWLAGWHYIEDVPFSSAALFIGMALTALPILGLVEWRHKGPFEARLRLMVGRLDLVRADTYYSGSSAMLVYEHKGDIIGEVALDGRYPGQTVPTLLGEGEKELAAEGALDGYKLDDEKSDDKGKDKLRQRKTQSQAKGKGKDKETPNAFPTLAEIRHLNVDSPWRRAGVATELVGQALDIAFGTGSRSAASPTGIEKVIVLTSPYTPGREAIWTKFGFTPVPEAEAAKFRQLRPLGIFPQKGRWLEVDGKGWPARRAELFGDGDEVKNKAT